MIDVFYCFIEESDLLRQGMTHVCLGRWDLVEGARIIGVSESKMQCSPRAFQRMRRIFADERAKSDVYIVADDDCLLPPDFNLDECVRIFKESGFSTLSLMPSNATIQPWTPENYTPVDTPDVMEHFSAGQVRFCRKGHMETWPPMEGGPGYDGIHGAQIRKQGGRVGYFKNHKALHLGEGFSTIWNPDQGANS